MTKWQLKKELEIERASEKRLREEHDLFERKRHWCGHCVHGLLAASQNHCAGTDKYYVCELLSPCEKFERLPSEAKVNNRKNER